MAYYDRNGFENCGDSVHICILKPLKYIDGEEAIKYNPEIEIKPTPFSKRNTSGIKRIISLKSIFPMRLLNKNMLVKLR